jgi:hypothetical protein
MKNTGAWVRMRRVKATAFEVSKTGDAQKALDIAAEHQKVLEEEAAQIEDLIKTKRGKIPDDVLRAKLEGNLAEQKGVNKTALVPMQLHLAVSADNEGGSDGDRADRDRAAQRTAVGFSSTSTSTTSARASVAVWGASDPLHRGAARRPAADGRG